jgi:hypothetical protein
MDAAYELIHDMETSLLIRAGEEDLDTTRRTLATFVDILGAPAPQPSVGRDDEA